MARSYTSAMILSCPLRCQCFRSTPLCSNRACGWRRRFRVAQTRWRCCESWPSAATNWAWWSMLLISITGCAEPKPMQTSIFAGISHRSWGCRFMRRRVDTAAAALADAAKAKPAETIEEAARRLRYGWFRELMASGDGGCRGHGPLRGTTRPKRFWPSSCAGRGPRAFPAFIPWFGFPRDAILRPLLATTRSEIEAYLGAIGQNWREDSSNRHLTFTRNRIRHELLPLLEGWNPRLREHLAQMAELARDEEAWWAGRSWPGWLHRLFLPGRPVRGGGRAAGEGLAIEVTRLAELPPALCSAGSCAMRRDNWGRRRTSNRQSRCASWPWRGGQGRNANWPRVCGPSEPIANCS